ncbi:GTPase-activating protein S13 [Naganishia albida]|nr:GTPase-activating protein S13 [Naganishia albida]
MTNAASVPAAAPSGNAIETAHEDMIHDAQLDYYGKRLATCSSDRTVRVFNVVDGKASGEGVVLKGHTGPVWQVAWGHPSFGTILASCSYDSRVYVWKEKEPASVGGAAGVGYGARGHGHPAEWEKIKEHAGHSASVNSIAWAPYELGAILACASSDGNVSVLQFKNDGSADGEKFQAHAIGVNAVSWSPANMPGSLSFNAPANGKQIATVEGENGMRYQKRLATGGCDPVVRIWSYKDNESKPELEEELHGHTDWVRDVAWAPNIGLPGEYIATASQDRTVLIHYRPDPSTPWKSTPLRPNGADQPAQFPDTVWRVSWSLAGNILAVSCGDGKVTLWKEVLGGGKGWEMVNEMNS